MFDSLTDAVSGSSWTYAVVLGLAALDVIFPLVPSETAVILAGVVAGAGNLSIELVIAAAAVGAVIGDNTAYWIGRLAEGPITRRLFSGERRKRLDWAKAQVQERGGYLIIIARFIPGGRTAVTLAAGILRMWWPKFIAWDVAAGIFWGTYAGLLGYFGGKAFEDQPWKGLLIALGVAFSIAGIVELVRWLKGRRAVGR